MTGIRGNLAFITPVGGTLSRLSPGSYFHSALFAVLIHSMAAGYCGASARIKFDDEQFAALFNEPQARGDKNKPMQLFGH